MPGEEDTDQRTEAMLLERVEQFSGAMLEEASEVGAEKNDEISVVEQVQVPAAPPIQSMPATVGQNNNVDGKLLQHTKYFLGRRSWGQGSVGYFQYQR